MAGIRDGFRNPLLTGVEIPDGTITTTHLADLAVTTAKIANLAVTNAKIDSLAVDKLTAGNILAQTITIGDNGSQSIIIQSDSGTTNIRSSNFVDGTSGWKIQRNGDAEFNDVTVRGTLEASLFRTAASGARLQIDGSSNESFIEIFSSSATVGFIGFNATGYGASEMVLTTEVNTNPIVISAHGNLDLIGEGSAGVGVHIQSDAAGAVPGKVLWVTNEAATEEYLTVYTDGTIEIDEGKIIRLSNAGGPMGIEWVGAGSDSSPEASLYFRTSPNTLSVEDSSGTEIQAWDMDNGHSWLESPQTTTNSGLAAWRHNSFSGGGPYDLIPLVSSSERWKKYIRDLDELAVAAEIDSLRLREWQERASVGTAKRGEWVQGVIAEEVFETAPHRVRVDDDGRPALIDISTALTVPILAALKDARRRIAELESVVAALPGGLRR